MVLATRLSCWRWRGGGTEAATAMQLASGRTRERTHTRQGAIMPSKCPCSVRAEEVDSRQYPSSPVSPPPGDMYVTRSVGLVGLLKLWFACSSLSYLPNQTTRRLYSHSAARPPHHGNGSVVSLSSVTRPCSPEPFPPRARESSAHAARLDLKRELSRPRTASTQLCVRLPARVDARPPRTTPDHPARPVPSG